MNKHEMLKEMYPDWELKAPTQNLGYDFSDCLLGVDERNERLIYSVECCINTIMQTDECTWTQAEEMFNYNVKDAYVGEKTPVWCDDDFLCEESYIDESETFEKGCALGFIIGFILSGVLATITIYLCL